MVQKHVTKPEEENGPNFVRPPSFAGALLKLECASEAIRRIEKEFEKISGGEKWDKTKCLAYLMQIGFKNPIDAYKMISNSSKMISDAEKAVRAYEARAEKAKTPKEKEDLAIKANITASLLLMKFWEPLNRTDLMDAFAPDKPVSSLAELERQANLRARSDFGNSIFYIDVKNPLIKEKKYSREFEEVSVVVYNMPLEKAKSIGFSLRKELMDAREYLSKRFELLPIKELMGEEKILKSIPTKNEENPTEKILKSRSKKSD